MSEEIKVDRDYLEAFNLGYELAIELDLKSPMSKDLDSRNNRMKAMQAGMIQYTLEIVKPSKKEIDHSLDFNDNGIIKKRDNQNGKGFDLSI
ncbi:hypothetical protein [Maribacter sp. 2307UL18-2]|uniref:hypothetical protein n=1 Tax=Maribacter sp. 2307UL18-2 TaxID=3386274 RepID=UPI0039BD4082